MDKVSFSMSIYTAAIKHEVVASCHPNAASKWHQADVTLNIMLVEKSRMIKLGEAGREYR